MTLYTLKSQQNQWNIVWNFEKNGKILLLWCLNYKTSILCTITPMFLMKIPFSGKILMVSKENT